MTTKKTKPPKSTDYKSFLFERLADKKFAAEYLSACFEDGPETFLLAMKDVVEAHGGIGAIAKATKLNREGLYDMLSRKGNPRFSSLQAVLKAVGIELRFAARSIRKSAA